MATTQRPASTRPPGHERADVGRFFERAGWRPGRSARPLRRLGSRLAPSCHFVVRLTGLTAQRRRAVTAPVRYFYPALLQRPQHFWAHFGSGMDLRVMDHGSHFWQLRFYGSGNRARPSAARSD